MTLDKHEAKVVREAAESFARLIERCDTIATDDGSNIDTCAAHVHAEALRSILPKPRYTVYQDASLSAWGWRNTITGVGYWLHGNLTRDQAERICAILNEEVSDE